MIIIPMAGLSSRFSKAGYNKPKYMLPLHGKSVFYHSINSFKNYFLNKEFLFIARSIMDTENFLQYEINNLGIKNAIIIILDQETAGQAETVEYGIHKAKINNKSPLTIFNIDTFRQNFMFPEQEWFKTSDGYLEVFKGEGKNWSYVEPSRNTKDPVVIRTTEKEPISDLCCNGLYHFKTTYSFLDALKLEKENPSSSELYIAPLYNYLIKDNNLVHYSLIKKELITFCGVPDEYESLLKDYE